MKQSTPYSPRPQRPARPPSELPPEVVAAVLAVLHLEKKPAFYHGGQSLRMHELSSGLEEFLVLLYALGIPVREG